MRKDPCLLLGDRVAASPLWGWVWRCQVEGLARACLTQSKGKGLLGGTLMLPLLGRAVHVTLPQHSAAVGLGASSRGYRNPCNEGCNFL